MMGAVVWKAGIFCAELLGVAYLTYLLELPVLLKRYGEKYPVRYSMRVLFLVNFITNIPLNMIVICFVRFRNMAVLVPALEGIVVIAEGFMYRRAFEDRSLRPFVSSLLANLKSFLLGLIAGAVLSGRMFR